LEKSVLLSLPGVPWVIIQTRKNGDKKEKKRISLIMMIRYHDGLEFKCQKNNLDGAQQRKKKTIDLGHVMLLITSLLLS
jgi:hypothetical protein